MGYSVMLTHDLGKGRPDMVVGASWANLLCEIKIVGRESKLTPDEVAFHANWRGPCMVATSSEQIHQRMLSLRGDRT